MYILAFLCTEIMQGGQKRLSNSFINRALKTGQLAAFSNVDPFKSNTKFRLQLCHFTPYNVGSVLWRLFSTVEVVQYAGGCSVHRRITSVLWGVASVL